MLLKNVFGIRLRELREKSGLSMRELAERAGLHQSTISRLESDMCRVPNMDTFIHLAQGFGLSVQELAMMTNLIEPSSAEVIGQELVAYSHLLTEDNIALLKGLQEVNPSVKYYLIQFINSMISHHEAECVEQITSFDV